MDDIEDDVYEHALVIVLDIKEHQRIMISGIGWEKRSLIRPSPTSGVHQDLEGLIHPIRL